MVPFALLRSRLLSWLSPGRQSDGGRDRNLLRLAGPAQGPRGTSPPGAAWPSPARLPLPPAAGQRLLLHPVAGPLPAALLQRAQGRPARPPAAGQPADRAPPPAAGQPAARLTPAEIILQGGGRTGAPPPGWPPLRQAPAALCRA